MSKSYKQLKQEIKKLESLLCAYKEHHLLLNSRNVSLLNKVEELTIKIRCLEDKVIIPEPEPPKYEIGKFGQAGIVFYDKGYYSDGWRYMEVAESRYEFKAQWSEDSYDIKTMIEIGLGKQNTYNINSELLCNEVFKASQLCANLGINQKFDWFLPSKNELNLIYENLHKKGIGDFRNDCYWSSSQDGNNNAWLQGFSSGSQYSNTKYTANRVRAIRAF